MQEFNRQIVAIFDNSHVSSETYPSQRVFTEPAFRYDLESRLFLVYRPIFNGLRSPDITTKKNQGRFKQQFFKLRDVPGTAKD